MPNAVYIQRKFWGAQPGRRITRRLAPAARLPRPIPQSTAAAQQAGGNARGSAQGGSALRPPRARRTRGRAAQHRPGAQTRRQRVTANRPRSGSSRHTLKLCRVWSRRLSRKGPGSAMTTSMWCLTLRGAAGLCLHATCTRIGQRAGAACWRPFLSPL
jgi:hypothetical protein